MQILWLVIVGLVAGWAAGKLMKGSGYGVFMDIIIGIVGAVIGNYLMGEMGYAGRGGLLYSILVATGGAVVLVVLVRFLIGGRGTSRRFS